MITKPENFNKAWDLVEFAAENITTSGADIESIVNWTAEDVAEDLANEIDTWCDNIEFTDRQYKDLIEVLTKLVKKYESEISERVQKYVDECEDNAKEYYLETVGRYE